MPPETTPEARPAAGPTPDVFERVAASFARQGLMATLGARLERAVAGEVDIVLPVAPPVGQQHGFVHGGAVATIADSACGYAALTLMPAGSGVLSTEFKIQFLAPAAGAFLRARGRVVRAGRTLTVALAEVDAVDENGRAKLCALMTASLMAVANRDGVTD